MAGDQRLKGAGLVGGEEAAFEIALGAADFASADFEDDFSTAATSTGAAGRDFDFGSLGFLEGMSVSAEAAARMGIIAEGGDWENLCRCGHEGIPP